MLVIQNGTLVDPENSREFLGDLWIEDGKIVRVVDKSQQESELAVEHDFCKQSGASNCEEKDQEVSMINAQGCIVGPGLIDTHVHFRDPGFTYKEDIYTGAEAAKKGGYTGIVLMANTNPAVDNQETLEYVLRKGAETGIRINSCVTVTKGMQGRELVDMDGLSLAGAVGFTDDGKPIMDADLVKKAMEQAKKLNAPISFHEENPEKITNNGVNAGKAAAFYGIGGSPREAEIDLIGRDLKLAEETGAAVVIQHISSKEGVELVRQSKSRGADVHAEATPHHFTLTEEAVIQKGTMAKMNPPLREEADRLAIIEGLKDGTIDLIATDHAPHSAEEKAKELTDAPSGILGLETALSLGIRELVQKEYLTYPELFMRMSTAPANLYHLPGGKLAEGEVADLVIFDPNQSWKVEKFASKSQNSPFLGETLPGVIKWTICDGKVVYAQA